MNMRPRVAVLLPATATAEPRDYGIGRLYACRMGLLIFSTNVTLDGCVDHQEGIVDNETHAFFTCLMDESGAMLWGGRPQRSGGTAADARVGG